MQALRLGVPGDLRSPGKPLQMASRKGQRRVLGLWC